MSRLHSSQSFSLRHSSGPFIAFGIPILFVIILVVWAEAHRPGAYRSTDFFLQIGALLASYFGLTSFFWRYRIRFDGVAIAQTAPGLKPLTIQMGDISSVRWESARIGGLGAGRPTPRIVIYTRGPYPDRPYIDVSIRHFVADDIRRLMRGIRAARPDLELPHLWV
jgi:hypothetical protein